MITIPKQLQQKEFRFCLIHKKEKMPFEKDWQKTANYKFNDKKLLEHLKNGGNYGTVGGFGNLINLDCDSEKTIKLAERALPKTFTVERTKGKRHYRFICKEQPKEKIKLMEGTGKEAKDLGEIQTFGGQMVGPNCTHPDGDIYKAVKGSLIVEVSIEQLKFVYKDHIKNFKESQNNNPFEAKETIPITDVIDISSFKKQGEEYFGEHPVHGSNQKQGHKMNLWVNPNKNCWHCFRCDSGGDAFYWIAVQEKIIDCADAKAGFLKGELFIKAAKAVEEKTGRKILKEKQTNEKFEILKTIGGEDFILPIFEYNTNHLTKYNDFVSALGIRGQRYKIINKVFWYQLNAAPIKLRMFKVGEFTHDLRIHIVLPLPMGRGKNEYKIITQKILKAIGERCHEPEISHVEQLIGTIVIESKKNPDTGKVEKVPVKIYGWMYEDLLQFDESHELMTSDRDTLTDARRHIRKATNPYGKNTLEKKLTKIVTEEKMEYDPPVQIQFYTQPKFVDASFIEDGTGRRFRKPYIEMPGADQSNYVSDKLRSKKNIEKNIDAFVEHLRLVKAVNGEWIFTDKAVDTIDECQKELASILQTLPKKVREYALGLSYQNTEDIIRWSCILAASNYENIVKPHHVLLAYCDVVEIIYHSLYYVSERVLGSFDYGISWKGASGADQSALLFLAEHKAFDEESAIELKKFKEFVKDLFGISDRAVSTKVSNYEMSGWIETKHDFGSYSVYLAFKPKFDHERNERNACNPKNAKLLNQVKSDYSNLVLKLLKEQGDASPLKNSSFESARIANMAHMDKSANTSKKQGDFSENIRKKGVKCDLCGKKSEKWDFKGNKKVCKACLTKQKVLGGKNE